VRDYFDIYGDLIYLRNIDFTECAFGLENKKTKNRGVPKFLWWKILMKLHYYSLIINRKTMIKSMRVEEYFWLKWKK